MYVYVRLCLLACTCIYLTLLDVCTYNAMYFSHVIKKLTHAQNIPFGVLYILYLFINIGLVLHARWWCLCTRHWRQCSSKRFGRLRYTRRVWNGLFVLCTVLYVIYSVQMSYICIYTYVPDWIDRIEAISCFHVSTVVQIKLQLHNYSKTLWLYDVLYQILPQLLHSIVFWVNAHACIARLELCHKTMLIRSSWCPLH